MVEGEAEPEQQAALDVRVLEPRVARGAADGAEEDRVVPADRRQLVVRQHVTGREVARGAERELRGLEDGLVPDRGGEHLQRLRDDLGADAVAADDRQTDGAGHG